MHVLDVTYQPFVLLILSQNPIFIYLTFFMRCKTFHTFCCENKKKRIVYYSNFQRICKSAKANRLTIQGNIMKSTNNPLGGSTQTSHSVRYLYSMNRFESNRNSQASLHQGLNNKCLLYFTTFVDILLLH